MTSYNYSNNAESLWVLFKLKDSIYAIDSSCVESIIMLENKITLVDSLDRIHPGIIPFRDQIIPTVDLRCLLNMPSLSEEQEAFDHMLEQRKQDHIHWTKELQNSIENDTSFGLATDPHKCAFGKWYDYYKPTNLTVAHHLKKIDEPHKQLHASAVEAFACQRDCKNCKRETCLKNALKKATEMYMPQVVSLLDNAKKIFRDSYRTMLIVISDGIHTCGLLVDEVISAEPLESIVDNIPMGDAGDSERFVRRLGQRSSSDEMILILEAESCYC